MNGEKVVIIGSGGLAAECVETINAMTTLSIDGYIDDLGYDNFNSNKKRYAYQERYLGKVADYPFAIQEKVIVAFSAANKSELFSYLLSKKVDLINLVHPSVSLPKSSQIGIGNIIGANIVIGPNVRIGNGNVLTAYSFVSHDCQLGNFNFFSTAGISGRVCVGDSNFFGIRSTVLPEVMIGDHNTIQAGMVVDKSIANNTTIFYKYKEKMTIIKADNSFNVS